MITKTAPNVLCMNVARTQYRPVFPSVHLVNFSLVSGYSGLDTFRFKALFSIHKTQWIPRRLADNLFDCSGEAYRCFQQHVDCNLEVECHDGRDERGDCPFSGHACQGLIASGNKCFFLLSANAVAGSKGQNGKEDDSIEGGMSDI
jgi:hypothetical protein